VVVSDGSRLTLREKLIEGYSLSCKNDTNSSVAYDLTRFLNSGSRAVSCEQRFAVEWKRKSVMAIEKAFAHTVVDAGLGPTPMPLLRFDIIEGRSESDVRKLLDVTHGVLIETLPMPKRDRHRVLREHKRFRMIVDDTGLGFVRSDHVLLLQVTSRPRSREMKENFCRLLVERFATHCGIFTDDVIVNFVTNADEDRSIGAGRAQSLTGELSTGFQAKARIGSPA
jgi:Tautomerase enzyme